MESRRGWKRWRTGLQSRTLCSVRHLWDHAWRVPRGGLSFGAKRREPTHGKACRAHSPLGELRIVQHLGWLWLGRGAVRKGPLGLIHPYPVDGATSACISGLWRQWGIPPELQTPSHGLSCFCGIGGSRRRKASQRMSVARSAYWGEPPRGLLCIAFPWLHHLPFDVIYTESEFQFAF